MRDLARVRVDTPTPRPPPLRLRQLVGGQGPLRDTPNRPRSPPSTVRQRRLDEYPDGNVIGVSPGSKFPVDQLAAMVIDFLGTAELPENLQSRDLTPTRPTSASRCELSDRTHHSHRASTSSLTDFMVVGGGGVRGRRRAPVARRGSGATRCRGRVDDATSGAR